MIIDFWLTYNTPPYLVNPSRRESVEQLFHMVVEETSLPNFLLMFNQIKQNKKVPISQDLIN